MLIRGYVMSKKIRTTKRIVVFRGVCPQCGCQLSGRGQCMNCGFCGG